MTARVIRSGPGGSSPTLTIHGVGRILADGCVLFGVAVEIGGAPVSRIA